MKFLHLSDLHIGKSVNGFTRLGEQRHVFEQIIGYIKTEHPNAVIIAGDVYDRAVPGVENCLIMRRWDICMERNMLAGRISAMQDRRLSIHFRKLGKKVYNACGTERKKSPCRPHRRLGSCH